MDLTISSRFGFALVTETNTGRTAVAVPDVSEKAISFFPLSWHDDYETAFAVVVAYDMGGVTAASFLVPQEYALREIAAG